MKIAIITDQHFGARKGSKFLHEYFKKFYDDVFFTSNLKIPKDKIEEFLIFCDDNFPSRILLKKDNEFELIDFLVKQSEKYQKILN